MRTVVVAASLVSVGFLACGNASPTFDAASNAVVLPSATPHAPATPATTTPVALFEGHYDAQTQRMDIAYRVTGSDGITTLSTLPYGTGANQVYFHTVSVTWEGGCGTSTLCAPVTAVNGYAGAVTGLSAVFDAIVPASVIAVGAPYSYGTVAGNGASSSISWTFTDPTAANFSFIGHAEGTAPAPTGSATLSASPTTLNLGTIPLGTTGANGSTSGTLATVSSTITDTSTTSGTGSLNVAKTGATSASIVSGSTSCAGSTLSPLGTCSDGYILDCTGTATQGAKSATITVSDPLSTGTTSFTVSGTCGPPASGTAFLKVSPTTKNLGSVSLESTATATFKLSNTGTGATGTLPSPTISQSYITVTGCTGSSLSTNQFCNYDARVSCERTTAGAKSGTVTFTAPNGGSSVTATVSATCTCVDPGDSCIADTDCCSNSCDVGAGTCN